MFKNQIINLVFVALFLPLTSSAQRDSLSTNAQAAPVDELIFPPLDSLFKWSEENSASLRMQDALIEKTSADTRRVKKQWLDAFKLSASLKSGSYGNAVINQVETGYSYGPGISFSLYEIASRRNLVDVYKSEEKIANAKKEEAQFELRRIVTLLHNNARTQKNILKIKSDAANAAFVHEKMAEKEFQQGAITLGELSRVSEIYTKAQTELELTINDLKNYYMQLEQICGRSFNN